MNKISAVTAVAALAATVVIGGVDTANAMPAATTSAVTTSGTVSPAAACPATSRRFLPTRVTMPGIVTNAKVVLPPRSGGVPGTPPLTQAGKWMVAMDKKWPIRPGDPYGIVVTNAHVWPDGSALGNAMLRKLHLGDRIVVKNDTRKLCYRVVKKIQVSPTEALKRYYKVDGPPRFAIVVCSGTRLAPGVWSKRTIWFAEPKS